MKYSCIILLSFFLNLCSHKIFSQAHTDTSIVLTKKQIKEYVKIGAKLYALNCSQCHNKEINKKTLEPSFTLLKLQAYKLRVANREHGEHLPAEKISEENMQKIIIYLTDKIK